MSVMVYPDDVDDDDDNDDDDDDGKRAYLSASLS
jgi:hypothetical protein